MEGDRHNLYEETRNCTALCAVRGDLVAQWLRCCATSRKVAGSIPQVVIGILH